MAPHALPPLIDDQPTRHTRRESGCKRVSDRAQGAHHVIRHSRHGKGCDHHGPSDEHRPRHDELSTHRLDRTYAEIIQEVRVAQTGVQVTLAFVLTLAFTPKFGDLTPNQLRLYLVTLVLGAMSASLLMAPAAFNRLVFRQALRRRLVTAANRFALTGLTFLLATLGCAVLLILWVIVGSGPATALTTVVVCWFVVTWFAVPVWWRFRHRECGSD
jgi:Family of unknown function (DUF6328)